MFTKIPLKNVIKYVALVFIVIIAIGYKKFHTTVTGILMMGEEIDVNKLADVVGKVSLLYSKVQRFNYTPLYTKHLSHWSLLLTTRRGYQIVLSPHENSLLRVIFVAKGTKEQKIKGKTHFIIPFRDYIVGDTFDMFGDHTALEYVKRMDELNAKKKYNIINYNCQLVVTETVKYFDPMIYMHYQLGPKLVAKSAKEMLSKKTRL